MYLVATTDRVYCIKQVTFIYSLIQIKPDPIIAGVVCCPCKLSLCVYLCFENICNLFIAESHNSNPGCEIFVHTVTAVLRGYGITRSSMHY